MFSDSCSASKICASAEAGTGPLGLQGGLFLDYLPVTGSTTSLWVRVLFGGDFLLSFLTLSTGSMRSSQQKKTLGCWLTAD